MYKRIILKLSGESLSNGTGAFTEENVNRVADVLCKILDKGVQLGVVLGGGNIWRGRFSKDMDPVNADQMGMLATVINALCVSDAVNRMGHKAQVFTAQEMNRFAKLYTRDAALEEMEKGSCVLLAGGTGNPFFTTDTGAALRCAELKADAVFKGTTQLGVYTADPRKDKNAVLLKTVSYAQCIDQGLSVMDMSAYQMAINQKIPEFRVFSMDPIENILKVIDGEDIGTHVTLN